MSSSDTKQVLAANLLRIIDRESPRGERRSIRAWATKRKLDVRLITRLAKAENAVTVDKLDEIAAACGLQAWHLLIPDLDPANPPDAPISAEDRALLARLRGLLDKS